MKIKPRFNLMAALLVCLLSAGCGPTPPEPSPFEEVYAGQIDQVLITIDEGEITVEQSETDQTRLIISDLSRGSTVLLQEGVLKVDLPDSGPGDRVQLSLAGRSDLEIKAYQGLIKVIRVGDEIELRSTAGDIELIDFSGSAATLWAGRGNILVAGGSGKAAVFGEHGELSVSSFAGPVSISTIMGEIQYTGTRENSGEVNLEADHGPIQASLPADTDYLIEITTASGEVECSGAELEQTASGCRGVTGGGNEGFNIRTVSGRIVFRLLPPGETD